MMKGLHGEFLLAWRCSRTDRKDRPSPSLVVFPTIEYVTEQTVSGEVVIRDIDGSEWKATYQNELELLKSIKDFNRLTVEMIKIRNGES